MTAVEFVASSSDLWRTRAACRDPRYPNDWWFPPPHQEELANRGIAICRRCPVGAECEIAGRGQSDGVWNGRLHKRRSSPKRRV